jgi:hypothetical protein
MSRTTWFGIASLAGALSVSAGPAGAGAPSALSPPSETIELDAAGLAQLRQSNPNHYARAQRILTAANYLCRPRAPDLFLTTLGAQDLSCQQMLLQTSNPPQWRIAFRLDERRYAASIVVTDDPAHLVPAAR